MSRFYGEIIGERGSVTKCGHKYIESHIRGWDYGIKVVCSVNERGNSEYRVYKTGGSNNSSGNELIHKYEEL